MPIQRIEIGGYANDGTGDDSTYFYVCIATNTWRRMALGNTY